MTGWQFAILGAYGVLLLLVVWRHVLLTLAERNMPFLLPRGPQPADFRGEEPLGTQAADWPSVSVLVPAKDEEATIADCLRSLLDQDYPDFEIIVIDDRSTDGTAKVVRDVAERTGRVRLLPIDHLPPGWTGKTHALYVGQQHARGRWLLFVDADTRHHPACLRTVMRDALERGADLLSLLPALDSQSFWERVIQPFAGICLMVLFPLPKVNDPKEADMGFANGQFLLIRREAYDAIGGHEAVRDKFVEDVHLGRLIRRAGRKLRVAIGRDVSRVRMYSSLGGIVRGWSRILYSAVDSHPKKLYLLALGILLFSVLSYAILIAGGGLLIAGWRSRFLIALVGMAAVQQVLQTTLFLRIYALSRSQLRYVLLRFLAVGTMLYILAKTIRMCRTHRVQWRGTEYGAELQRH